MRKKLVVVSILNGRATSILSIPECKAEVREWLDLGAGSKKDRQDFAMLRSFTHLAEDQLIRFIEDGVEKSAEQ